MRDLKYLAALTIPLSAIIGLYYKGTLSFLTPIYAFVFIPLLEVVLPQDNNNLDPAKRTSKEKNKLFDYMLYINIPLVLSLLSYFFWDISNTEYTRLEIVGTIISMGIVMGTNGINVAHELGHRNSFLERFLAKLLLLPSLYMHFYIEHNYGHHVNAATTEDPATAKYNQSVYSFWLSSTFKQYISAWKIQRQLLSRNSSSFISTNNDMLWYTLFQILYLFILYLLLGFQGF